MIIPKEIKISVYYHLNDNNEPFIDFESMHDDFNQALEDLDERLSYAIKTKEEIVK